ncbi:MAG: Wzz/FepE/Etk N-terminal domain-containing protein, partial [Novosphingobium sp.]
MNATVTAQVTPLESAPPASGLALGELLHVLTERRRLIFAAGALGLILGIIASLLMTPLYKASALLELNDQTSQMLQGAAGGTVQPVRNANQELLGTQIGLLRSAILAKRVVEDLNLASQPDYGGEAGTREQRTKRAIAIVIGNTEVEQVKGSLLFQVRQIAKNPVMAANIANGLARSSIASSLERRYDASSYARKFLSDQLTRSKAALEDSERNLNAYSMNSGVFRAQSVTVDGK